LSYAGAVLLILAGDVSHILGGTLRKATATEHNSVDMFRGSLAKVRQSAEDVHDCLDERAYITVCVVPTFFLQARRERSQHRMWSEGTSANSSK